MEESFDVNYLELCSKVGAAVLVVDIENGEILFANSKVPKDLDRSVESIIGNCYEEVFSPEFLDFYRDLVAVCSDGEEHTRVFHWTERALWEQVAGVRIIWDNRRCLLLTITNVNEAADADYDYKRLAFFDNTTGLPNARKLEEDINDIADVERVRLVFFEIENMREIYDIYGWEAADAFLVLVTNWLKDIKLKRTHLYQKESIFIMMGRGVSKNALVHRARIIQKRFSKPWVLELPTGNCSFCCQVNVGVISGKYARNEMMNIIDRTLDTARNNEIGYAVYDEGADKSLKRERLLRNQLLASLYNNMKNFSLVYQPIIDLNNEKWFGAEALSRWVSPSGEEITPLEFIPLIEQVGLISKLDAWARREAMRQCSEIGLNKKLFFLDVNFSLRQNINVALAETILLESSETGFPPEHLIFEITETERAHFGDELMRGLKTLRQGGVLLSLDDFGTGYSSIENLIKLVPQILKTDKVIVDDIESDPSRRSLAKDRKSVV